jgi:predicted aspartyl protease
MINAFAPLGINLSSPIPVNALIDTGAHTTVLNPETIARLGIKPVGVAPIATPTTTAAVLCNRYHINLYFAEDVVIENVFTIEAPMGGVPYHCLIGRDVLRLGTLLYEGSANRHTLSL